MKIAVTSTGPGLDDQVEARFGRCPYFLIIDPDTMALNAMANPNISLGGGVGPQSAQLMAEQGVSTVLTGNCGPNAFKAFGAVGINVITGIAGIVRQAVDKFKKGQLTYSTASNVQSHFGMGSGKKMGRGCGGGMGMGGGGGMGRGIRRLQGTDSASTPIDGVSVKDEIERLKIIADSLRDQLKTIDDQIVTLSAKK